MCDMDTDIRNLIQTMDDSKEMEYVDCCRIAIASGSMTKEQAREYLIRFMGIWGNPPSRAFNIIQNYISELKY